MDLAILKKVVIEIPLIQIGTLAGLCTLFALWGKFKLILISIYGFILYWVFILNEAKFLLTEEAELLHTGLFVITSLIFVGCGAWAIFMER